MEKQPRIDLDFSDYQILFERVSGRIGHSEAEGKPVLAKFISTPIGILLAGATEEGLCFLEFTEKERLELQLPRLGKYFRSGIVLGESPIFSGLENQLYEYFKGKRKEFDTPLVTPGTEFQQKVWKALASVPYGQTNSYEAQAIRVGDLQAIRAVAKANGENRIAILIPCHRIIGKNGDLIGYGGGLWRKKFLLELERKNSDSPTLPFFPDE
ncbi:methylated-DNA--[protein]-cysteine S-methyltransferase [Leptospira wolffii]|uniref:methylated-DNA--[protein]-cysteine S-methyltransferase n=1 Tax=Leptospira wolffii TaxID=409998 RepID=UPI000313A0FA|nr:methylated-DNA--[protein]-cysteine S-methyltransferase [Leptospira wolffii]EPG65055.1 methylated-DNA--[protein]-cysteine S-methyltransferase [Leptospira wolffii serovar Khorat str. Khorat-H2]